MAALSPATLEGWYVLHQMTRTDWAALRALPADERARVAAEARALFERWEAPETGGWSAAFRLVGREADWLFLHFRPSLDELAEVQLDLRRSSFGELLDPAYDYLSVPEGGVHAVAAEVAAAARAGD